jgi:hypothetical protein
MWLEVYHGTPVLKNWIDYMKSVPKVKGKYGKRRLFEPILKVSYECIKKEGGISFS